MPGVEPGLPVRTSQKNTDKIKSMPGLLHCDYSFYCFAAEPQPPFKHVLTYIFDLSSALPRWIKGLHNQSINDFTSSQLNYIRLHFNTNGVNL